ncbi:MAG: hypothetical protein E7G96_13655 [Serratia liquefaciens]|nr:hypothetical protein [Serratia liquefaciens]
MDKFSEPNDNLADAMNSLRGWKQIAEAADKRIAALLAELEAKDKRIAELERSLTDAGRERDDWVDHSSKMERRAIEAERKLATPVRLHKVTATLGHGDYFDGVDNGSISQREKDAKAIRAAGFTVEGDE